MIRVVQASPKDPARAIEMAWTLGCQAVAWDLREDCSAAVEAARSARLRCEGWYSVARDLPACAQHPEWMHAPHRTEWLGHSAQDLHLVAPYIGLNNVMAANHARRELLRALSANAWCGKLWLADIQGPPMGCGCGNPCCRCWDNSPGEKIVDETPNDLPDRFFSQIFFESVLEAMWETDHAIQVSPILCPGCECGIRMCGVDDPDGLQGTGLCHGVDCSTEARDYWPELLERFRAWSGSLFVPQVGLLLMCDALRKNHPVYGAPRNWPLLAHSHYGREFFPCVEQEDAGRFQSCLVMLDAPQDCWPVIAPSGYQPALRTVNA